MAAGKQRGMWIAFFLLKLLGNGISYSGRHLAVSFSNQCTCTVIGTEVTCRGSGTLTKTVVQSAGTYTKYTKAIVEGDITVIGAEAFNGCSALNQAIVTAPVTTYGNKVFDVTALSSFKFGKDVISIDTGTFNNAKQMKKIEVEAGNTKYCAENGILYNIDKTEIVIIPGGLTSITIPESVKILGNGCNVWSLMNRITTTETLERIGRHAFYESALTYIYIGSNVTYVDNAAFQACAKLEKVEVSPNNAVYDSTNGIFGCGTAGNKSSIIHISWTTQEVNLSQSLTSLGSMVFVSARGLTTIYNEEGATNAKYTTPDGVLVMEGTTVIGCAGAATAVTIPETATRVRESSFRNLLQLETVTFTNNVTIEGGILRDCKGLKTLNWGKLEPVTTLSHFCSGTKVSVIVGPSSLKRIEGYAFADSKELTDASFPGVEQIDSYAFTICYKLVNVRLPAIKTIHSAAFSRCTALKTVFFGNSLKTIESTAFSQCSSLEKIELPASVNSINSASFSYCDSLIEINVADECATYSDISGVLYNKDKTTIVICPSGLKTITLPESTLYIQKQSFCGCSRLVEVFLNDNIQRIEAGAFHDCGSIQIVRIPANIQFIGAKAFDGCPKLKKVLYCSNKVSVKHDTNPFPSSPDVWAFWDFASSDGKFCGLKVLNILDHECNIPTSSFTYYMRGMQHRASSLLLLCNMLATELLLA